MNLSPESNSRAARSSSTSWEEGEQIIEKLTRGGKVTMPFAKAPWGAHFGVVEDKFGLAWNITTGDGR